MTAAPIGILGGTFCPIHNGHVRVAIEVRDHLHLKELRLITSALPPHRDTPGVPPARRHAWVQRAIAGEAGLVADDRELHRTKLSYTVDTLAELRREHPAAPLCLVLGDDAARGLGDWHRPEAIAPLAHIVVVRRPGAAAALPPPQWSGSVVDDPAALRTAKCGRWYAFAPPLLAISSTAIRTLLRTGRSIRGLIPDTVLEALTPEDLRLLTEDEAKKLPR